MPKDPICGMEINEAQALKLSKDGKTHLEKNKNIKEAEPGFSIFQDLKMKFKSHRFTPLQIRQDIKGVISGSISPANMIL